MTQPALVELCALLSAILVLAMFLSYPTSVGFMLSSSLDMTSDMLVVFFSYHDLVQQTAVVKSSTTQMTSYHARQHSPSSTVPLIYLLHFLQSCFILSNFIL